MDNKTALSFWLSIAAMGVILIISSFLYLRYDKKNKSEGKITEFSDKLLTFIFTVCLIAPFAAYLSLLIAKNIFSLFLVVIGETPDWLGFVGSIFGGFITLVAVIFTKLSTQEEAKKQISLLSEQIAESKRLYNHEVESQKREEVIRLFPYFVGTIDPNYCIVNNKLYLLVTNKSSNPIYKLSATSVWCFYDELIFKPKAVTELIPPGEKIYVIHEIQYDGPPDLFPNVDIRIDIEYFDLLGNGPYNHSCSITIDAIGVDFEVDDFDQQYLRVNSGKDVFVKNRISPNLSINEES